MPFKSEIEGQMHGCGHDAHTAILLAVVEILNNQKAELNGTVRLIFQSGEETGTGANEDLIPTDEPNWVGVDSHINAMYPKQIRIMRPSLYNEDEDIYCAIEPEDAVIYCKELIERYNLKYIGENTIHDNCKADGI